MFDNFEGWVAIILFLLVQAGALVAILTQIRNELKHVNRALSVGGLAQVGQGKSLTDIESRLDRIETRLEGYHDLEDKIDRMERFCIATHGDGRAERGQG